MKGVGLPSDDGPMCAMILLVIAFTFPTGSSSAMPLVRATKSIRPTMYVGFVDSEDNASYMPG